MSVSGGGCGGKGGEEKSAAGTGEKAALTLDEEYRQMVATRKSLDDAESKVAVSKKFLERYPDTDKTARTLAVIFDYQAEEMDDMPGAVAYAESVRTWVSDPANSVWVDRAMLDIYGRSRDFGKMLEVADRLSGGGDLRFIDHWTIITNSVDAEKWDVALDYCSKALPLATAETFRADYPDDEFTDEEVTAAASNRQGMLLVSRGRAKAGLGRIDEALGDFQEAAGKVRHTFFGTPEYRLDIYWGEALLDSGDAARAMDRFAVDALILRDEAALAGMKRAYEAIHGSMSGYDAFAAKKHREIAKRAEDFELAGYDGVSRRFGDMRGEVTMLAFWFPT